MACLDLGNLGRAVQQSHISTEAQGMSVGYAEGRVGWWSVVVSPGVGKCGRSDIERLVH